jgi:hypothetical protein
MIRTIMDEYEKQKSSMQQEKEKLKLENKAISKAMTDVYIKEVNKEVLNIHSNQRRIVEEIKKLKVNTQEFIKQSRNWISLYDGLLVSLKEAGDIANWYNVLEYRTNAIKDKLKSKKEAANDESKEEKKQEITSSNEMTVPKPNEEHTQKEAKEPLESEKKQSSDKP